MRHACLAILLLVASANAPHRAAAAAAGAPPADTPAALGPAPGLPAHDATTSSLRAFALHLPAAPSHALALTRVLRDLAESHGVDVLMASAPLVADVASSVGGAGVRNLRYGVSAPEGLVRFREAMEASWRSRAHTVFMFGPLFHTLAAECEAVLANATLAAEVAAFGPDVVFGDFFDPCPGLLAHRLGVPLVLMHNGMVCEGLGAGGRGGFGANGRGAGWRAAFQAARNVRSTSAAL